MSKISLNTLSNVAFLDIIKNRYNQDYNHYYKISNQITFNEILVKEELNIEISTNEKILFNNCHFESVSFATNVQELTFLNTVIGSLILKDANISKISINDKCTIKNEVHVIRSSIANCQIDCPVKKIDIVGSPNWNINLTFSNDIDTLMIDTSTFISIISLNKISNCNIKNSKYPFKTAKIEKLDLENVNFNNQPVTGIFENVVINSCSLFKGFANMVCINNLSINNCTSSADGEIKFSNVYVGGVVEIQNIATAIKFLIETPESTFIKINKLILKGPITNVNLKNLEEDRPFRINTLEFINVVFPKENDWAIQNLRCSNLLFNYFKNCGTGNIDNTSSGGFLPLRESFDGLIELLQPFDGIYSEFFDKKKQINFSKEKNYVLTIRQSDFGKLNFINTDFSDFKLKFYSTKLNEIFLAGSKMPKTVEALNIDGADLFHQQRIANTQLKKLHELHGDVLAANGYFSNEMNAYYHSLKLFSTDWAEKSQLWLNKISSNHGQSWIRALKMTLITSLVLYFIFCCTLHFYPANPFKAANQVAFWKLVSYYPEFINPIHKLENFNGLVNEEKVSSFSRIIDFPFRIINSYFIYQLIQAFRKHSRAR